MPRERVAKHLLAGSRVVAQPLEVARLQRRDIELVVLVRQGAGLPGDDRDRDLVQRHVLGAEEVLVLPEHHDLVVVPGLEREGPVADEVGGLRPLVAVLLDRAPVGGQGGEVGREHREVAARPLECHLQRPVALGHHADLGGIGHFALVERLGALDVVEEARVGVLARRVHLALPRPLEVLGRTRRAVRPLGVLADGEGPHRAVRVGRDLLGDVGDGLEVDVELHEAGPERGYAAAVQVLVVVVAGGVVLPPAAAADPYVLLAGELLARGELRRRRDRPGVEAGRAQGGEPGRHFEEVAPAHAGGTEPLGQQIHLRIGDRGSLHGGLLSWDSYFILGSSASRTPSPKNVNESIVIAMAMAGNTHRCQ